MRLKACNAGLQLYFRPAESVFAPGLYCHMLVSAGMMQNAWQKNTHCKWSRKQNDANRD